MSKRIELVDGELAAVSGGNILINTTYNQVKNTTTGKKYNINNSSGLSYQQLSDWITNNRTSLGGDNGTIDEMLRLGYITEIN